MRPVQSLKKSPPAVLAALVIGCWFGVVSPASQAKDPCSFLSNIEAELSSTTGVLNTIGKIYSQVYSFLEKPFFTDLEFEEGGVYFTRRTGFYFTLDCSAPESKRRIEKIGLFGVGDSFLPVKKRMFSDEDYYYGLTRSGLMAFVRKADLRKMNDKTVYFFNRTNQRIYYCTRDLGCVAEAGRELNPRYRYASMDLDQFEAATVGGECSKLDVKINSGLREVHSNGYLVPDVPYAQLEYCPVTHKNGVYHNTSTRAAEIFSNLNVTGQYFILSSKSLREKVPFLFTRKECGDKTTLDKNKYLSLGGSIQEGVDFKLVKLEGEQGLGVEYKVASSKVFEADKQYIFQNYTANFNHYPSIGERSKALNDIVITQHCREGTSVPEKLTEVAINISPERRQLVSIDIDQIHSMAQSIFRDKGVWASSTGRKNGRAWYISSLEQDREWEKLLFRQMYHDVKGFLPTGISNDIANDYADYYRSIFMATSFEYVNRSEIDNIKIVERI